jgi:hypothetical protein
MRIRHAAEVDEAALFGLHDVDMAIEPAINDYIAHSPLKDLDVEILYVPIVMGPVRRLRYPARSRMYRGNMKYGCSPQLDDQPFVARDFKAASREYLRGLEECQGHLARMGASADQVESFGKMLSALQHRFG